MNTSFETMDYRMVDARNLVLPDDVSFRMVAPIPLYTSLDLQSGRRSELAIGGQRESEVIIQSPYEPRQAKE